MEYILFQVTILEVFDQTISAIFKHQPFRMIRRYLTNKTATPSPGGLTSSMVYSQIAAQEAFIVGLQRSFL